jgi:hypothetical protein
MPILGRLSMIDLMTSADRASIEDRIRTREPHLGKVMLSVYTSMTCGYVRPRPRFVHQIRPPVQAVRSVVYVRALTNWTLRCLERSWVRPALARPGLGEHGLGRPLNTQLHLWRLSVTIDA